MPLPAYHVGPGHLNGAAGKAEAAAFVPGQDGGGGEVEWSGNPVGEVSARAVAARHVRAVSGDEAAYRAERDGRDQPGCVGVGRGHVDGAGSGEAPARPVGGWGALVN